jgi:hypothetical protein
MRLALAALADAQYPSDGHELGADQERALRISHDNQRGARVSLPIITPSH